MECLSVTFRCLLMLERWGSNFKLFGACAATGRHMLCPSSLGPYFILMFSADQEAYTMAYANCEEMHPLACVSRPMTGPLFRHMEDLDPNPFSRIQDSICFHHYVLLWKGCPSAVSPYFCEEGGVLALITQERSLPCKLSVEMHLVPNSLCLIFPAC